MLIKGGRVREGLALLDEGMVAVTAEELVADRHRDRLLRRHPRVPGGVRGAAGARMDAGARGLVGAAAADGRVHGPLLVHRAEIMQLDGSWQDALEEARRAGERFVETGNRAAGLACYRQGELLRLQGDFGAAEDGVPEGERVRVGAAAGPRPAAPRAGPHRRSRLGDPARGVGSDDPRSTARDFCPPSSRSCLRRVTSSQPVAPASSSSRSRPGTRARCSGRSVAHARGAVHLAEGEPREALVALRKAGETWHELDAPYEIARTRVLVGDACRLLGDDEAASLEHEAARTIFERLGAKPDLARFETPTKGTARAFAPRARGPAARRRRQDESRDRRVARHQRAHGRAARPEHLREARAVLPRRRDGVRVRARPRLTLRAWSELTTSRASRGWWIPAMFGDRRRPTVRAKRRGGRDGNRILRDRDRRRRPGGARDRIPPAASRAGRS